MFGFWVGLPEKVHSNEFGEKCKKAILKKFDKEFISDSEAICSNDCAWNFLSDLYKLIAEVSGEKRACQIKYSEAFLPLDIQHTKLKFGFFSTSFLRVSSLELLLQDLNTLGKSQGWPTSSDTDTEKLEKLRNNEELFAENPILYTYCEFLNSSKQAKTLGLPLWVA